MNPWHRVVAAISLAIGLPATAVEVVPAQPRAGQDFILHITGTIDCGPSAQIQASVTGTTITVAYRTDNLCGVLPPGRYWNVLVNVPQPGTYAVVQKSLSYDRSLAPEQITVFPAVAPATRTSTSLAGLWYVPGQEGWGVNIAEGQSGQLFLTWFTYGGGGPSPSFNTASPLWFFTSGGQWTSPTEFGGLLALGVGTPFNMPFNRTTFQASPAGATSLVVTGPDSMTFIATLALNDGVQTQTFNLTRYKF